MLWTQQPFSVSTERGQMDIDVIHRYLARSYWSPGIPREIVLRAMDHSICFGLFHATEQIGFARIVSDWATFAYLADVFVLEEWRGRGLSKFLMSCIMQHPELRNLRRWMLATKDAHGLYEQFGFARVARPERLMEIIDLDVYQRLKAEAAIEGASSSGARASTFTSC
jgi:GNAT superfamily N-acetyltransferase